MCTYTYVEAEGFLKEVLLQAVASGYSHLTADRFAVAVLGRVVQVEEHDPEAKHKNFCSVH